MKILRTYHIFIHRVIKTDHVNEFYELFSFLFLLLLLVSVILLLPCFASFSDFHSSFSRPRIFRFLVHISGVLSGISVIAVDILLLLIHYYRTIYAICVSISPIFHTSFSLHCIQFTQRCCVF